MPKNRFTWINRYLMRSHAKFVVSYPLRRRILNHSTFLAEKSGSEIWDTEWLNLPYLNLFCPKFLGYQQHLLHSWSLRMRALSFLVKFKCLICRNLVVFVLTANTSAEEVWIGSGWTVNNSLHLAPYKSGFSLKLIVRSFSRILTINLY